MNAEEKRNIYQASVQLEQMISELRCRDNKNLRQEYCEAYLTSAFEDGFNAQVYGEPTLKLKLRIIKNLLFPRRNSV